MEKKIIGLMIAGLFLLTLVPTVNATVTISNENESTVIYESRIFGVGLVRINGFTHTIKGFVLIGIHDGQVIKTEFVNIKYSEAEKVLASYLSPVIFIIAYNPA